MTPMPITAEIDDVAPSLNGHIDVNDLRYYYAIYGKGEPLLLLHGGLGQIEMFGPVLKALASTRQVIGVDLHGHGRSSLGEREMSLVGMGDDMAAILRYLGLEEADVLGYSLGGSVALRFAAQHGPMVRRLVMVSAPFAREGYFPEILPRMAQFSAALAEPMKDTPLHRAYTAVSPHPENFPKLLDRVGELLRKPYDWSEDVARLTMPVMLVYGDSDMIRPEHAVKFYQLLGGGLQDAGSGREHVSKNRLAILPDLTHYEIYRSPRLAATVLPFLDGAEDGAEDTESQPAPMRIAR